MEDVNRTNGEVEGVARNELDRALSSRRAVEVERVVPNALSGVERLDPKPLVWGE